MIEERARLCDRHPVEQRLFVYGSLKRGFRHHDQLAGARFIALTRSADGYELVRIGQYPAMVGVRGAGRVVGELYAVDAALLRHLDAFEEVPERYQRVWIEIEIGGLAWCYTVTPGAARGGERLGGGAWVEPA